MRNRIVSQKSRKLNIGELALRILIFLMLASWLYGIPPIPGILPKSPMYLTTAFVTVLLFKKVLFTFQKLLKRTEFLLFFIIVILIMLIDMYYGSMPLATMLLQFCAIIFLICIYLFSTKSPENKQFIIFSTIILLTISVLWFLAEISIRSPFVQWRLFIYKELYSKDAIDYSLTRSGLVSVLHALGYQISFLMPILLFKLFTYRNFKYKELFYALAIICGLCAMWFSSQRSAVLGVLACLIFFSIKTPTLIFKSNRVIRVMILIFIAFFFTTYNFWDHVNFQSKNLVKKFNTSTIKGDDRLTLQKNAISIIFDYPLGLRAANLTWIKANEDRNINTKIAVHNVYLGLSLKGGILILLLQFFFLIKILSTCFRNINYSENKFENEYDSDRFMIYGTAISCFILQPMFHNAGLFTFEGSSLVCFALYLVVKYQNKNKFKPQIVPQ